MFPSIQSLALEFNRSDHRSILLRHDFRDYDSLPFKFYNAWLCWDGFEEIVSNAWNDPKFNMDCPFSRFKNKLKNVKNCLKSWVATVRVNINKEKKMNLILVLFKLITL